MRWQRLRNKVTTFLSLFSLLLNIAQPAVLALSALAAPAPAYATDASASATTPLPSPSDTPTPTPADSSTPSPSPSPSATATPLPLPTSSPDVSPSPTATDAASPAPSLEPTATPSATPSVSPTSSPTANSDQPANTPSDTVSPTPQPVSPAPSVSPSPSTSPAPEAHGTLSAAVISNTAASSLSQFDFTVNEVGSATLTTNKADYAPTDTAIITGTGYVAGDTYTLTVSSNDPPATSTTSSVTADGKGEIFYAYQLDGTYRPNYLVQVFLGPTFIASTTFFDHSDGGTINSLPSNIQMSQWKTVPTGNWITGSLGSSNSDYVEGQVVPFQLDLGDLASGTYRFSICRDYSNGSKRGYLFLSPYSTSRSASAGGTITSTIAPFDGVNITINSVNEVGAQGACNAGQRETQLQITSTDAHTAYLLWGGHLASPLDPGVGAGNGASSYPGSSLQMTLLSPSKSRSINPSAIIPIQLASITVTKVVDSGSAAPNEWCFNISPNPNSETLPKCPTTNTVSFANLPAGSYSITETNTVNGYSFASGSGTNCTFSGSTATASVIADVSATNASCTFHNTQTTGTLIINKTTIGGDGTFNYTVSGPTPSTPSITTTNGTGSTGSITVNSGAYTVTETVPTGWTMTTDCSTGFTIPAGDTKTCNFTNTKLPTLKLVKVVHNNYGGTAIAQDWTLTATGTGGFSDFGNSTTFHTVQQNTAYALSESIVTGYTMTKDWSCDGGTLANDAITLAAGENVTCTIENSDIAPQLIVKKHVINDNGGSKLADDFTMTVAGGHISPASTFSGSESGTTVTLDAGNYSVDELPAAGYTKTIGTDCSGTIVVGEIKSCTITNDDIPGHLKIVKNTVGGDGTFTFDVAGTSPSTQSVTTTNGTGETSTFDVSAGQGYSISENVTPGWALTDSSCTSGVPSNFSIDLDQTVTCTFTNTKLGSISGFKYIDTNGNGTLDTGELGGSGWLITLWNSANQVVDTQTTGTDGSYSFTSLLPDTYSLTETLTSGWTPTAAPTGGVVLGAGDVATGENFLNFQNVSVTACKVEDADGDPTTTNDQTLVPGWTVSLTTDGKTTSTETTGSNGCYTWGDLGPDHAYGVEEETQAGWSALGTTSYSFGLAQSGSTYSYTFANFHDATIIVHKSVVGTDGKTPVTDFTNFTAYLNSSDPQTIAEGTNATYSDLGPGTYTVTEPTTPTGYSLVSVTGDSPVTVQSGHSYDVYVTNQELPAQLTVIKHVVDAYNGGKVAGDFTMHVSAVNLSETSFPGSEAGTLVSVDAGSYSVSEDELAGYTASYSQDCSGTLAFGGSATCTITNTAEPGHLIVTKYTDPSYDTSTEFSITATGSGTIHDPAATQVITGGSSVDYTVDAGTYSVTETPQTGWDETDNTCSNVAVANGETQYCTITNTERGNVIVTKYDDTNGNGQWDNSELALAGWTINLAGSATSSAQVTDTNGLAPFTNVAPYTTYNLSENIQTGWRQTNISCSSDEGIDEELNNIDTSNSHPLYVYPGDTTYCYIGNQQEPVLSLTKTNNATGNKAPGDQVQYTLTVHLDGSALDNVVVTDLPPAGFTYHSGSWTSDKAGVAEPTYHSPGKWYLGSMQPGDTITLTYLADVSSSIDPGTYKDLAWVEGSSTGWGTVLGNQAADPLTFVGTSVTIDKGASTSVTKDIEGEVLGASTVALPATGAGNIWLVLAAICLGLGTLLLVGGRKMRNIFVILAVAIAFSLTGTKAHAADDPSLSVVLSSPKSPQNTQDLHLAFTVLDTASDTVTVICYKKAPADSGFSQFDSTKTLLPGGNNGTCDTTSATIGDQGNYEFYVTAEDSSGIAEASNTVGYTFDSKGPDAPSGFRKDHTNTCRYMIYFHTAVGGDTTKVAVYRSTNTNFTADSGTLVGTVTIGPDTDGQYEDNLASDCDKTWYYEIRAFDNAGNGSDLVGDGVTTVVPGSPVPAVEQALAGGTAPGVVLGAESKTSSPSGEVLGEGTPSASPEIVPVTGVTTVKNILNKVGKNWTWWLVAAVACSIGIYVAIRKHKRG